MVVCFVKHARAGVCALGLVVGLTTAQAQTNPDIKANNSTALSTGSSWASGIAPNSTVLAQFDSTLNGTITSAAIGTGGINVLGLVVTNTGGLFTISATTTNALTIGSSGIDMSSASNGTNNFTIASAVVLSAAQTWNVASSRGLTVSKTVDNGGGILTLTGAGTTTLSAVVSDTGGLIQAGNGGTTILSATNTYTGDTTVRAGTLDVAGSSASGANGRLGNSSDAVIVGDSGTLSTDDLALIASAAGGGSNIGRDINVNNYGSSITLGGTNTSGTNTFSGTITLSKDVILTSSSGGTVNFSGAIDGSSNITVTGGGTVDFKGANDSAMGSVTISSGTLNISGGSAISDNSAVTVDSGATLGVTASETVGSIADAGAIILTSGKILTAGGNNESTTFSGVISSAGGLTKTGTGTLTLNGSNTYTGATTVNTGTLLLDLSLNPTGVLASTTKPTLGGGTLDILGASSGTSSQTLGNAALTADTFSQIIVNGNGGSGTTLTLGNTLTRGAGSTLNIDISAANSYVSSSPTVTSGIINAAVTVTDATGTGFGNVTGGDITRYIGGTALPTTATTATVNYYDNTAGTLTLSGTEGVNSLTINGTSSGAIDLHAGVLTVTSGGVLDTSNNNFTISNGNIGANNKEVIVHQMGSAILTISANISSGTGSFTKDGPGEVSLTGNSTFSGTTVISGGTVLLANTAGQALSNTGTIVVNTGGTLMLGASNQINSSASITLAGGTLSVNGQSEGTASTAGVGALTLSASSTIDLSGGNGLFAFSDSSGATWASGATLDIADWNGLAGGGGNDEVFFGTSNTGLTAAQLADIQFINPNGFTGAYGATMLSSGEVVANITPVPEPGTAAAGAALAGLLVVWEWRRRKSTVLSTSARIIFKV